MQVKCSCKYVLYKQFGNSVVYLASYFCSYMCVCVWFSLQSEYTPRNMSHMNAIHHLSWQKQRWKPLLEAISYTFVWLTFSHKLMTPEFLSSPTILSLELQTYLLSHPPGIFMWMSYSSPNTSCLKLNSFSILFPQPNCSFFSVVHHFHRLYYQSPSSLRTLRIIFHVSQVNSLVLFIS